MGQVYTIEYFTMSSKLFDERLRIFSIVTDILERQKYIVTAPNDHLLGNRYVSDYWAIHVGVVVGHVLWEMSQWRD